MSEDQEPPRTHRLKQLRLVRTDRERGGSTLAAEISWTDRQRNKTQADQELKYALALSIPGVSAPSAEPAVPNRAEGLSRLLPEQRDSGFG